jgi:LysM repeat protein
MSELLCDLSWGRPGGKAIKAAGYSGVLRYLSHDTTGKNLSASERDDYFANGLSIRLVYENGSQAALGGHAQGFSDGQNALQLAQALGLPKSYGIYYAVDFDATPVQQTAIDEYGNGFREGLAGYYDCAEYAGYWVVSRSIANGTTKKSWQTLAWSGGNVVNGVNIYQNGKSDFGGAVDVDELRNDDGWNWTAVSGDAPTSAPAPVQHVSAPAPVAVSGPGGSYTVQSGDTLSGIGAKTGTDWRAIAQLNNISSPFTIYPNEVLHLPGGQAAPQAAPAGATVRYTVQSGDTLSAIGAKFGVSYLEIARINGIADPNKINAGQVLVISGGNTQPASGRATYTVVSGDTLSGIGAKEGVDWRNIASLNNIAAPFVIFPGQELKLS